MSDKSPPCIHPEFALEYLGPQEVLNGDDFYLYNCGICRSTIVKESGDRPNKAPCRGINESVSPLYPLAGSRILSGERMHTQEREIQAACEDWKAISEGRLPKHQQWEPWEKIAFVLFCLGCIGVYLWSVL